MEAMNEIAYYLRELNLDSGSFSHHALVATSMDPETSEITYAVDESDDEESDLGGEG
jgi:hypothetical protein